LWYSFALTVDPADNTSVYLAEETLWRYYASNNFWSDLGSLSDPPTTSTTHADQHAAAWISQGDGSYKMLLGNDGGVWLSSDPTSIAWSDYNTSGLSISQMYKGSVHPKPNNALALAGTQDNGTAAAGSALVWNNFLSGDGGDNAISASNPDMDWAASWETFEGAVNIYRTQDAGTNMANESSGIDPSTASFFVHFEKSPNNDNVFIAGTAQLWLCTNFFSDPEPFWASNSPVMLDASGLPVNISAMAFAPSDTNSLTYAYGTEDGQLQITTNGGGSWQNLNALNAVPGRDISGLAFHPSNSNVLYVTLSGFDEGTPGNPGHLFETTNARAATPTWINRSPPVDLPNDCIAIDPNNGSSIFVGTDLGVWMSSNGGVSWTYFGPESGMPNVAVFDMRINSASQVTAFTHGRGAFIAEPVNIPILVFNINYLFHPYFGCLSCPLDGLWINPGDLVTIEVPLQGIIPVNTVDLQATLLSSAQVQPITGTQDYGVVVGQGAAVSRAFQFIAGGSAGGEGTVPVPGASSCGQTAQAVIQLQDQGVDLGQITIPFRLGIPSHPMAEDFNEVPPPGLPPGWAASASGVDVPWMETSNTPPNVVPGNVPDDGGDDDDVNDQPSPAYPTNVCAFTPAPAGPGQSVLYSAPFMVATSQAQLSFRQAFTVSNAFDGCTLQIAVGSQPFQDILQAGGSFAQNGYNVVLNGNNPLGPRPAWSGNSGGWLPTLVNLPPDAAGQTVQLSWNFATSRGLSNGGWYVDSVEVTEPTCLPPVSDPIIVNTALISTNFTFAINTVAERTYVVEYKTNLTDAAWTFLENLSGNGSLQTITVPISSASQSFFRFHLQ
jgi:hypothetical protein